MHGLLADKTRLNLYNILLSRYPKISKIYNTIYNIQDRLEAPLTN